MSPIISYPPKFPADSIG